MKLKITERPLWFWIGSIGLTVWLTLGIVGTVFGHPIWLFLVCSPLWLLTLLEKDTR